MERVCGGVGLRERVFGGGDGVRVEKEKENKVNTSGGCGEGEKKIKKIKGGQSPRGDRSFCEEDKQRPPAALTGYWNCYLKVQRLFLSFSFLF